MTNLFTARTDTVLRHAQVSYASARGTFHASHGSSSPIQKCHRQIVLNHGSLALMPPTETRSLPAAYARTRIEYP
jgi:hypothetical protein